jgi:hypothetical protein
MRANAAAALDPTPHREDRTMTGRLPEPAAAAAELAPLSVACVGDRTTQTARCPGLRLAAARRRVAHPVAAMRALGFPGP